MKNIFKRLSKFNKVVIYLSLSDVFTWGSYALISTLTGLYLANKLGENTVQFVGIGTSIYFLTRALFQIPIGTLTDKHKHDKDEILLLFCGILLMGFPFLLYPHIQNQYHYYVLQFIFGLGVSLNVTTWRKLFALNVDKGKEGRQYSIYEIIMSASTAVICVIGGYIANMGGLYFDTVISLAGCIIMLGGVWTVAIYKYDGRKSRIGK